MAVLTPEQLADGWRFSTKLMVKATEGRGFYFAYRAPGPHRNPNCFSVLGTDGWDDATMKAEAAQKYCLFADIVEWKMLRNDILNPANKELIRVMLFDGEVAELALRPAFGAGLVAMKPEFMATFGPLGMLSPAMPPIMAALPDIFG